MKYNINDIIKRKNEPIIVDESVDFSSIAVKHHDIRKISLVKITGVGNVTGQDIIFDLEIKCELTLPCAITLEDVKYPLDIKTREIFTFRDDAKEEDFDYDINIVKGHQLELASVVWQNIILHIPLRVVSENAYDKMEREGKNFQIVDENNQEDKIDPRFAVLKNLIKK